MKKNFDTIFRKQMIISNFFKQKRNTINLILEIKKFNKLFLLAKLSDVTVLYYILINLFIFVFFFGLKNVLKKRDKELSLILIIIISPPKNH